MPYTSVMSLDHLYVPHSPAPPIMMLIQIPSQFHHLFIVKGILLLQSSFNPHTHLACYLYKWQNLQPSQQQQQPQQLSQRSYHRSPKSKPASAAHTAKPAQAQANEATEASASGNKKVRQPTPGSSPEKHIRGRQQNSKPPKDKMTRR